MSKLTIFHLFIFYISLFSSLDNVDSQKITEIYPYYLNVTAAYVSLENLNSKKYVYFSFNFDNEKNMNQAYFKLTTDSELSHSNIQYLFTEKKAEEITKNDLVKNTLYWYYIRGNKFRKDKNEQGFDSYLEFFNYSKEKKTLIIRLEIDGLKGDITIENLESLPEENSLINNKYNENLKGNKHNHHNSYNSQNNYHNNVINNEQRYSNNNIHNRYYHYHKDWRSHSHDRVHAISNFRILYGLLIGHIWLFILILYCLVNKRKRRIPYIATINNRI